ncbi:hypothetical protein [Achromobacter insuavis]|uniref:hypothetical protein n=1 Tax=Achromobacter insuavis TaxID=1287735 RepID=UPI000E30B0DD|nr:hypothetical protein [Achromobacter insuavis]
MPHTQQDGLVVGKVTDHRFERAADAGWLPIESAPKDGTPVLLFARLTGPNFATGAPYAPTIHVGAYRTDLCIWTGSAYRDQREIEIEPTCWMPRPAFPGCAAPASPVSTVEQGDDDQVTAILWTIMRDAQAAKEPCGDDPESAAAVRNSKLASIAGAAAQALGLVKGPEYPAPAAGDARLPDIDVEAAAKALAECMDYPWAHMPKQGRAAMRQHAQSVIRAGLSAAQRQGDV